VASDGSWVMSLGCIRPGFTHAVGHQGLAPTVAGMAAAFLGLLIGALVGLGVVALPTLEVLHAADSAAATLSSLLQGQIEGISFLEQNPAYLTGVLGIVSVAAPGIVAALVAYAAKAVGALRSVIALVLSLLSVWALVSLPLSQSLPLSAIAALVFFAAIFPAIFAVRVAMWGVVGLLAVDRATSLLAHTDVQVNQAIVAFIEVSGIDSPDLWRIFLSVVAFVPFVGALSQAAKAK
jgi:hypothetical protein